MQTAKKQSHLHISPLEIHSEIYVSSRQVEPMPEFHILEDKVFKKISDSFKQDFLSGGTRVFPGAANSHMIKVGCLPEDSNVSVILERLSHNESITTSLSDVLFLLRTHTSYIGGYCLSPDTDHIFCVPMTTNVREFRLVVLRWQREKTWFERIFSRPGFFVDSKKSNDDDVFRKGTFLYLRGEYDYI